MPDTQPDSRPGKGTRSETRKRSNTIGVFALIVAVGLVLTAAIAFSSRKPVSRSAGTNAASAGLPAGKPTVTPPIAPESADLFADVTAKSGIKFVHQFCDTRIANIIESNGAGGTWLDYDGDGFMDVYLVNSGPMERVTQHKPGTPREPNRLYRNKGDGTFEDVTQKAGVEGTGYGTSAAAADFDNDGRTDLLLVYVGGCRLYRNKGDGVFEDITDKAAVANAGGTGIGAVWVDVDRDGYLDLFVANYLTFDPDFKSSFHPESPYPGPLAYQAQLNRLYRNLGNGTFQDVSAESGIQVPGHRAMSVTVTDHNQDGSPDLYVSNDGTANVLLVNDGKGRFKDEALNAGVAFNAMGEAAGSMAATIGDCNGDGWDDLFVTRLGYGSLYLGSPRGLYDDRMAASGLGQLTSRFVGWGGSFVDFDNDIDQDLFIANGDALYLLGSESLLLENRGDGTFSDAGARGGSFFLAKVRGRGSAVADYDNDGRMDILATAVGDRPFLLHNRGTAGNHWLKLDLEGTRSNRDGFGALIKLVVDGRTLFAQARCGFGFLMQSDRRVHFGLGKAMKVERIEIRWPSKQVQEITNVKVDQVLKIREPAATQLSRNIDRTEGG